MRRRQLSLLLAPPVTSLTVTSTAHASPDDPVQLQTSCSTVGTARTGITSETRSAHGYGERTSIWYTELVTA